MRVPFKRIEYAKSSFATPIDELRFELVEVNGSGLMLDSLVFAAVPEPTSSALLVLGLTAFALVRSRRVQDGGPDSRRKA